MTPACTPWPWRWPDPGRADDLKRLADKFPTAGLAVIVFAVDAWPEVHWGGGRLKLFMAPKLLACAALTSRASVP